MPAVASTAAQEAHAARLRALADAIRGGTYVVDTRALAEAMLADPAARERLRLSVRPCARRS